MGEHRCLLLVSYSHQADPSLLRLSAQLHSCSPIPAPNTTPAATLHLNLRPSLTPGDSSVFFLLVSNPALAGPRCPSLLPEA